MSAKTAFLASILFGTCACSTTPVNIAEPIGITAANPNGTDSKGFIQDAMGVDGFYLLPRSVGEKLISDLKSGAPEEKLADEIRIALCNGTQARYMPRYRLELVLPKSPKGLPLDLANKAKRVVIEANRKRAKQFFDLASRSLDGSTYRFDGSESAMVESENPRFSDYRRTILSNQDGQAKWAGQSFDTPGTLQVPYVNFSRFKELKAVYSSIPFVPKSIGAIRIPLADSSFQPDYDMGLVDQRTNTVLLVPRVTSAAAIDWKLNGIGSWHFRSPTYTVAHDYRPEFLFYIVSDNQWKLTESERPQNANPLLVAQMQDAILLRRLFTFRLPREVASKISGRDKDQSNIDEVFGYTFQPHMSEHKFSPELAIKNTNEQWEVVFSSQTSVNESATSENTVGYDVALDAGLFCKYGVALHELRSK